MKYSIVFLLSIFLVGCGTTTAPISYTQKEITGIETVNDGYTDVMEQLEAVSEGKKLNKPVEDTQKDEQADMPIEILAGQYSGAIIQTTIGSIQVAFYSNEAPLAVNNFLTLVKKGFYNGTTFHRVIPGFMIQGGDPLTKDNDITNDGAGGPGYSFIDEVTGRPIVYASLVMANSGPNTNGSQFFIVTAENTPWLDGKHTHFGSVIAGMDVVHFIENLQTDEKDHPLQDVVIKDILLVE